MLVSDLSCRTMDMGPVCHMKCLSPSLHLVPNYSACKQKYMCVNGCPRIYSAAQWVNTYMAPQAITAVAATLLWNRRIAVQPIGQSKPYAAWSAVSGLYPHNPCNYMDYYSFTDPGGLEGWVGMVAWRTADTLPTKWLHVNHGSGIDQEKSAIQRPTS